jgi:hypothetical protein
VFETFGAGGGGVDFPIFKCEIDELLPLAAQIIDAAASIIRRGYQVDSESLMNRLCSRSDHHTETGEVFCGAIGDGGGDDGPVVLGISSHVRPRSDSKIRGNFDPVAQV